MSHTDPIGPTEVEGRRRPRTPRLLGLLAMAALVAGTTVLAGACSSSSKDAGVRPVYLFSVETDGAHVVVDESTGTEREVLMLPIEEVVTWFTDRPVRQAGNMTMAQFIDDWASNGFADDAPDAALTVTTPDGIERTHVIELTGASRTDSGVMFTLNDLIDSDQNADAAGLTATHGVETGEMEFIELFIESSATCARCEEQVRS